MYRGGVLEPEGTVEIKYRERDIIATINRLDTECSSIVSQLKNSNEDLSSELRKTLENKLQERYKLLAPMYHQIAVQFADLHDTPGRMMQKGVISVRYIMKILCNSDNNL